MTDPLTARQTARRIRSALRAAFPGTRISLTLARGTASAWMDARWTDGPTAAAVEAVVAPFRSSGADGTGTPEGVRYTCDGVLTHREYSSEARAWARATIAADPGHESPGDWHVNGRNYGAEQRLLDPRDLSTLPPG